MKPDEDLIAQINSLFHPRSVAVVGAPRGMKTGSVFLTALLEQGFPGVIYPVSMRLRLSGGLTPEDSRTFVWYMIEVQRECRKPLIIVAIPGYERNLSQEFCQAGIPFFESAERAMRTYALVFYHQRWRQEQAALG